MSDATEIFGELRAPLAAPSAGHFAAICAIVDEVDAIGVDCDDRGPVAVDVEARRPQGYGAYFERLSLFDPGSARR